MIFPSTDRDGVAELGRRIYHEKIEPTLSPDDKDRFVVVDVNSGDYEIADRDIDAVLKLKERREPGRFYVVRVGRRAGYSLLTRFNHRLPCYIDAGRECNTDTTTLKDPLESAKLRESEER